MLRGAWRCHSIGRFAGGGRCGVPGGRQGGNRRASQDDDTTAFETSSSGPPRLTRCDIRSALLGVPSYSLAKDIPVRRNILIGRLLSLHGNCEAPEMED